MHAAFSAKAQEARIAALEGETRACSRLWGRLPAAARTAFRVVYRSNSEDVDAEAIVKRHIKLLHQYNEAKDATQILIGKLASHKEMTLAQLHAELDLPTTD
ncbi:Swi5-domain-containing protein [Mucidula mucida]|nr:Swi5-domain-containing protein [Mucidula mucida]